MPRIPWMRHKLDVADSRTQALLRIATGLIVVLIVLGVAMTADAAQTTLGGDFDWWLIVVLAFVPYFTSAWRALRRGCEIRIDWERRQLCLTNQTPVSFSDVRCFEVLTVNGRCEEALLRATLLDGGGVTIMGGQKFTIVRRVAIELSKACGVALYVNPIRGQRALY